MPGTTVTTRVRTGPNGVTVAPASSFFVVGTSERGSTTSATLISGMADFQAYYGSYSASYTLYQQVQTFFEEGGTRVYVGRAVGASATAGALTLNASGSVPAMTLTAKNAGSWSQNVDATVVAGVSGGFVLKLYVDDILVFSSGEVTTVTQAVNAVNASTTASIYVTATAINGALALVVLALTPLTTGANGSAPTDAQKVTALSLFGSELGAGAVAIPGGYSSTVINGLLAHGIANNRIVLASFDPSAAYTDAITTAAGYSATANSEYLGFYFPYVQIPGPSGTTLTVPPEGYVAAKRAMAHNQKGPWQPAAGVLSKSRFVSGVASSINRAVGDALDDARVNAIRIIQNSVRIYGARSVSSNETDWRYLCYRDFINVIVVESERVLEDMVFSPIDGRSTVFKRCEARLVGLLEPWRVAGGLYEAFDDENVQIDPGYSVEVSDSLNPLTQLQTGSVHCRVGVRPSAVADKIYVDVVKSNLNSSVV